MLKMPFESKIIFVLLFFTGVTFSAATEERPQPELVRVQKGTYKIFQRIGQDAPLKEIGKESFIKSYYKANTIIIEGELELNLQLLGGPSDTIRQVTYLEIEEESHFPRRFNSKKKGKGVDQELSIEMFSNIAVIDFRRKSYQEKSNRVLSTGAMIIEGNFIHMHELLLHRFGSVLPGKQNIMVFNPVLKRELPATVEFAGEDSTTIDGESRLLKLYRIGMERNPELRLFVDDAGIVVKAENSSQEFVLTGFEEK